MEKINKKRLLQMHLLVFSIIIIVFVVWNMFDIGCVFRSLTGIPCPTCGATRAIFSLFTLDIRGYFYYHPMAFPMIIALLLTIHVRRFPQKSQKYLIAFSVIVFALTIVVYFFRLVNRLIP